MNRLLDDEGIAHLPIEIGDDTREAFVIAERESAGSHHVVPAGPTLSSDEERCCLDTIARIARHCDYFVLSGSGTPGLRAGFSTTVGAAGAAMIADIAGTQLTTMLAERVFLLRLDRVEAAALVGRPIAGYADARGQYPAPRARRLRTRDHPRSARSARCGPTAAATRWSRHRRCRRHRAATRAPVTAWSRRSPSA
ncbi:hypothetical protein [Nocardia fluminea]|uniref:hypothetical protein n=1 Tax=Nocardia fluminea TaxID=134984 RepID=UPI003D0B0000